MSGLREAGELKAAIGEIGAASLGAFGRLILPEAGDLPAEASPQMLAIGAAIEGKPVGLSLCDCPTGSGTAHLASVLVEEAFRRRGLGRALMEQTVLRLRQRGCRTLAAEFLAEAHEALPVQSAFLEACGFPAFRPGIHICGGPLTTPYDQGWFHMKLPGSFAMESWGSLTPADRRRIEQAAGIEYPDMLSPFAEDGATDPERSLLLRYKGEPVGWMLVEVMDERTLLYKTMYVYKRHQRLARGVALFAEAIRRAAEEGVYPDGIFFVEHENEPMREFVRKYFASPLYRKQILWKSTLDLQAGQPV